MFCGSNVCMKIKIYYNFIYIKTCITCAFFQHSGQNVCMKIRICIFVFYFYFVSPSNEGRHIVLVWFFFRFCFFSAKLVRTITCLSFEIGQWYLVCGCMTIRRCVAYRNDLCWTLTSRSNNCFLNSITC